MVRNHPNYKFENMEYDGESSKNVIPNLHTYINGKKFFLDRAYEQPRKNKEFETSEADKEKALKSRKDEEGKIKVAEIQQGKGKCNTGNVGEKLSMTTLTPRK